jgi:hypothetical protein
VHLSKEEKEERQIEVQLTLHVGEVKPRDVATSDQRLVNPFNRGLRIPLICTTTPVQQACEDAMWLQLLSL